ncbi:unnamed protein product [Chondrus crispus]|uniref:Uncharacterized protein n=1 Tax=Chondrus crispus TaxID=2769 RepID=R7QIM8_CHOCR|nr:unnamed protein product [Chondrus crispus]CDF37331.1 unnamed protein product [Chondrus crispus]|eukprot:XP_005717150.1 unnamed protein product [Chondrus crispus]
MRNEWILASRGKDIWFAGQAAAVLVRGRRLILFTGTELYVLEEDSAEGSPSIAVVEIASSLFFKRSLRRHSYAGSVVSFELQAQPRLRINCTDAPAYPKQWGIQCVDSKVSRTVIIKHDSTDNGLESGLFDTHRLTLDYGTATRKLVVPWSEFDFGRSRPASRPTNKMEVEVMASNDTVLVMKETSSLMISHSGHRAIICLGLTGDPLYAEGMECREKDWGNLASMASAFRSLQIETAKFSRAWEIYHQWRTEANTSAPTRTTWIAKDLRVTRGRCLRDTHTVATVNTHFFAGISILLSNLVCGVFVYVWLKNTTLDGEFREKSLTLDSSRKVLAMSNLTRFNCDRTPEATPWTAIVRSGDRSCHLETSYGSESDVIDINVKRSEKLILMGHRGNGRRSDLQVST